MATVTMRTSSLRVASNVRPTVCIKAVRPARAVAVIARAQPTEKSPVVEELIKEAEEACNTGSTGECAAAWDTVEEVSAATSDKRLTAKENSDPLEKFCEGAPDADECRVFEV